MNFLDPFIHQSINPAHPLSWGTGEAQRCLLAGCRTPKERHFKERPKERPLRPSLSNERLKALLPPHLCSYDFLRDIPKEFVPPPGAPERKLWDTKRNVGPLLNTHERCFEMPDAISPKKERHAEGRKLNQRNNETFGKVREAPISTSSTVCRKFGQPSSLYRKALNFCSQSCHCVAPQFFSSTHLFSR